ncbi:MAG: hypothetical protein SOV91_05200 [Eubacteriales bacterium]|nr:hypothetical protein [Eubacteriales bacterium]
MQTVESEQCSACTQAMHTAPAEKQSICSGLADRLFLLGCYCGVLLVDAFFSFWAAWAGF